jgi:hypothetical protein
MRPSRRWGWLAAVILPVLTLPGCASIRVNSYVERGIDFSTYRTYDWAPADSWATGDPRLDNNAFFHERIRRDIEQQLAARGFEKTASQPQLLLHYHASINQELDLDGADLPDGECRDCRPFVYDAGTLLLDAVDARTSRIVWRGWAEGSLDGIDDQQWMEKRIDEAVARLLEKLPRRL